MAITSKQKKAIDEIFYNFGWDTTQWLVYFYNDWKWFRFKINLSGAPDIRYAAIICRLEADELDISKEVKGNVDEDMHGINGAPYNLETIVLDLLDLKYKIYDIAKEIKKIPEDEEE